MWYKNDVPQIRQNVPQKALKNHSKKRPKMSIFRQGQKDTSFN